MDSYSYYLGPFKLNRMPSAAFVSWWFAPRTRLNLLWDVDAVFATIAEKAGVLDDVFTKEAFLSSLHDWESSVKPAYAEHKIARLRRLRDAEARHRRRARPRYGVRVGRGRVGGEAEELVVTGNWSRVLRH